MSSDDTRPIVEAFAASCPRLRLLCNERKITPVAMNLGIAAAGGSIVIRMDAHVEYPPDYISALVRLLEESGADNVGGVCRTLPAGESVAARAIALGMSHPLGVGNSHFRIGASGDRWVDTVPFGCYRREVFDRIGLFDEELVRNQDDELNLRLIRHGGRIRLSPRIVCKYFARDSLAKLWRMYYQYGYFKPLVVRRSSGVMTLELAPPLFVLCLVVTALAAAESRGAAFPWKLLAPTAFALIAPATCWRSAWPRGCPQHGWAVAAALLAVFPALHLSYGIGYLRGVVEFLVLRRNSKRDVGGVPLTR